MSNKTFFVLMATIFSPMLAIWVSENVSGWLGLFVLCSTVFLSWKYFKSAKDI